MAGKSQSRTHTNSSSSSSAAPPPVDERRKRVALRRLIDEMLAEIRAAASEENWTAAARAQAEADLARIMDQVRQEAIRPSPRAGAADAPSSSRTRRTKSS